MHEDRDKMANDIIYDFLINLVLICSGYLLHVYLRRQSSPSLKLGKSQLEMFGRRNNELSREQMRTLPYVTPVETRQFNEQYSRANVVDMNRMGSSFLYSELEQATPWEQMAKPMGTRLRECEMKPDMEYKKRNLTTPAEIVQRMETLIQEKTDATAMAKYFERTLESVKNRLEETCSELIQAKKENAILIQRNLKLEEKLEAFDSRLNFLVQRLRPDNRDEEMSEDSTNYVVVKKQTLDFVEVQHTTQEDLTSDDEQGEDIDNKGQEEMFLSAGSEDEKFESENITCETEKSRENEASDGDRIHKNVKYGDVNSDGVRSCESGSVVKYGEIDVEVHWTDETDHVKNVEILGSKIPQEEEVDEAVKIERNEEEEFHKTEHQKVCESVEDKQSDDDEDSEVVELGKHYEAAMTREIHEESESDEYNVNAVEAGESDEDNFNAVEAGESDEDNFNAVEAGESDEDNFNAVEAGESDESGDGVINEEVEREMLYRGRSVETILEEDEEEEEETSSGNNSDVTIYSEHSIYDQIDDIPMYFTNSRPISGSPEFQRFLQDLYIQEKI